MLDRTELEREVNIARNAYEQAVANKEAQDKEAALGYEKAVQDFQKQVRIMTETASCLQPETFHRQIWSRAQMP